MALYKVFIRNLKRWRNAAGISQEKLAELCHSSHSYIRQIECGSRYPSFSFIEKLANALNVEPYLLFYDDKMDKINYLEKILAAETEKELLEVISNDIHKVFEKLREKSEA